MSAPGPAGEDFGARLSFDRGEPGRRAVDVPRWRGEVTPLPDAHLLRESLRLPEMSQGELVRYYTALSTRNYGIDSGTYPLGSCTMKYNPKVNDLVASLPGFADAHPQAPAEENQGTLRTLLELRQGLAEITGLPAVSLAPAAGAQGELAGVLMVTRALEDRGELERRRRILVPDSAHGTNPATAAMAGFAVTQIPTAADGSLDRATIERELDETVAAVMVTVPNTLGLWERGIEEVADLVHEAGAYLYGDGANLNAIVGRVRYGDLGFDVVHLNLHKSFSTPHGGGGPGAGPVCCTEELAPYLPTPVLEECADGVVRLGTPGAASDGCSSSTGTSACSSAPTPTCARSALMGCAPSPGRPCLTPTTCVHCCRATTTCPTTGPYCTRWSSRAHASAASTACARTTSPSG